MLGQAWGEKKRGDVRAGLRVAHNEVGSVIGKRYGLAECHISAGRGPIGAPVGVKVDRDRFGGGNHSGVLVRGNSRQGKHFWVKRATFLCRAAYLSGNGGTPWARSWCCAISRGGFRCY